MIPPGKSDCRTPSIHQLSGVSRPITWTTAGRTAIGNTAPLIRNSAPPTASGYDHDSWRVWRQIAASITPIAMIDARPSTMTTMNSGQLTFAKSNGTPSRTTPTIRRDHRAHAADGDAGHAAAEQHDEEVARADVDVLQHPVALAIVEDRPGEPGDPGQDEGPERAADDDEGPVLGHRCRRMTSSMNTRISADETGFATE